MAAVPPICDFGWKAPDFKLRSIDNSLYNYADIAGPNGTLIMFISNHCPYVKAIETRITRDTKALLSLGIGIAAIGSNDELSYPDDGPVGMAAQARRADFGFPYLQDQDQFAARAYDAVCTPDFFGFDIKGGLQYRGRLDASREESGPVDLRRDLFEAMKLVAQTGRGPQQQTPSMGCSIKWKP
jgi:peroxiredoxin